MSTLKEYFTYQKKWEKKYGEQTVIIMMIGSFYEIYAPADKEDYIRKIGEVLNALVTRKDKSDKTSPYLVGFPVPSLRKYLNNLINAKYTVVRYDQVTPPPEPRRELIEIYSQGTYIDETTTPDSNQIVSVYLEDELQMNGVVQVVVGLSSIDLSTGHNKIHEVYPSNNDLNIALDEAVRFINSCNPKEILIYRKTLNNKNSKKTSELISYMELDNKEYIVLNKVPNDIFKIKYQIDFLQKIFPDNNNKNIHSYIGIDRMMEYGVPAYMIMLNYAYEHSPNIINRICLPEIFNNKTHLILGNNAIGQLNVIESNNDSYNKKFRNLFDVVNATKTAMGRRLLKNELTAPIISIKKLQERYNAIEELKLSDNKLTDKLKIMDIERLQRKLSLGKIVPMEFAQLIISYEYIIELFKEAKKYKSLKPFINYDNIEEKQINFLTSMNTRFNITELNLYASQNDIKTSIYNENIYDEADKLNKKLNETKNFIELLADSLSDKIQDNNKIISKNSKKVVAQYNERDKHYLKLTEKRMESLKKYFKKHSEIKITDTFTVKLCDFEIKKLPTGGVKLFHKKLTTNSEELSDLLDNMTELMKTYYLKDLDNIYNDYNVLFSQTSKIIAQLDFLSSGAIVASKYNYCKPILHDNNNSFINCSGLRHPIIEQLIEDIEYVPHDINLGITKNNNLNGMLVYGLNSSGKSVLMKSLGLTIILAQIGYFVPCTTMNYSPFHAIFARISGNDNLFKGLSSFALEMNELQSILQRSNSNTLVIGDEVCKGTEHISGNSIVASTLITLSNRNTPFIFATHLHDIPHIKQVKQISTMKCFHLTVEHDIENNRLIFDRKLKLGPGETIYGITVAKYIIKDKNFITLAENIRKTLDDDASEILPTKKSKYNKKIYIEKCEICKKKSPKSNDKKELDTHHINFQKNCKNGFSLDKPHLKKNQAANLVILCKKCHTDVHNNKIIINGWKDSTNGSYLSFKYVNS